MNLKKFIEIIIYLLVICAISLFFHNFFYGIVFILIHEFCHGFCAVLLGYNIESMKFIPFGVTANIKEEFIRPIDDILISLSGPLINFIFFAVFYILENYCNAKLYILKEINLALFIFNMIPAEFLDGGRILKILLKLYGSFYSAYVISIINGIITALIILFLSIYTKSILNGIILFVIALYILFSCYKNKKNIILNIIKDVLLKNEYVNECLNLKISIMAFKGNVNLLYIIKYFSFKKYYIIYLIQNGSIGYKFYESDIIKAYCSKGNINLEECKKFLNTQEVQ